MTENLLQKLEEKILVLLDELDTLRNEHIQIKQENLSLKNEKSNTSQKINGLLSLLEAMDVSEITKPLAETDISSNKLEYAE